VSPIRHYRCSLIATAVRTQALRCLDCHREGGRLDWQELGYKRDPLIDAMD
jgi:hypothetical protein